MWSFILLTAAAAVVEAQISTIGSCHRILPTDSSMNYKQFTETNKGTWKFVMMPRTEETANIKSMYLTVKKGESSFPYRTTIYCKYNGANDYAVLADEYVSVVGNGHVNATLTDDKTAQFSIRFLKYEPGQYAFYHICSDKGDDKVDWRYVIAQGDLTSDDLNEIYKLENKYKFSGGLIYMKPY